MASADVRYARPSAAQPDAAENLSEKRPRRRKRWLLAILVLLLLGLWFSPWLVAKSGLIGGIVSAAAPVNGSISVGSASLGWFSPVVLGDVKLRDADGELVLSIVSVSGRKPLAALLWNRGDLGKFDVAHPVLDLVLRDDGSNLEDTIAPLWQQPGSTQRVEVEISDGVATIRDTSSRREFQLEDIGLVLKSDKNGPVPLILDAGLHMPTDGQTAECRVALRLPRANADGAVRAGDDRGDGVVAAIDVEGDAADGESHAPSSDEGQLRLELTGLPLELAQSFLRRALPGAELAGRLSGDLRGRWRAGGEISLRGQLNAADVLFTADCLAGDELKLERVSIPCTFGRRGDALEIRQLAVKTDLGEVSVGARGRLTELTLPKILAALQQAEYDLEGQLDVARIANQLPHTLRLREGTEITNGQLTCRVASRHEESGQTWQGQLESSDLSARVDGRAVNWRDPLTVKFNVRETDRGITIDDATCRASFLTVDAQGTLDDLKATADCDLDKLVGEIDRFVDLGSLRLAGKGHGELTLKRQDAERFVAGGDLSIDNFQLDGAGRRPWNEPHVTLRLAADGTHAGGRLATIERGSLVLAAGREQLTAELTEHVREPASGYWPLRVRWEGELADWLPRIESLVRLDEWELAGEGTLAAELVWSPADVVVRSAQVDFKDLKVFGPEWFIDEPQASATASGTWDRQKRGGELDAGSLTAGATRLRVDSARFTWPQRGPASINGSASLASDLAQLARWRQDPRYAPAWSAQGELSLQVEIKHAGDVTEGRLDGTVDRFALAELAGGNPLRKPLQKIPASSGRFTSQEPRSRAASKQQLATWEERQLQVAARASYDEAEGRLEIADARIASDALDCTLAGHVATTDDGGQLDLSGRMQYDWQQLGPLVRMYAGEGLRLTGRETREFHLRGPWSTDARDWTETIAQMTGEAGIGWQGGAAYGLPIGAGELALRLGGGTLEVKPLDIEVSGGRLTLAPRVRLAPAPAEVRLPKGPAIGQVRLTPEVCDEWLKFVTPMLAQATDVNGQVSLDLDGGRIPLDNPRAADIGGRLLIHSAQVEPGPMTAELLRLALNIEAIARRRPLDGLLNRDTTLLEMDNCTVEFRVVEGRVYHRGLSFVAANKMPISTQGSVGFDESISMMAEFTIPDDWVADDTQLAGRKIQIPIEGTLGQHKIDSRALKELAAQAIEQGAKGLLLDQLDKQLNRLLPGGGN